MKQNEPYDIWKTKITLWQKVTTLGDDEQAPAVALTLEGAASAAVLKIPTGTLCSANGMTELINKLDGLYDEDKDQTTYQVYDQFEKFRRTENMSMSDYLIQFELMYQKAKQYNNILTEPVLAYRLLKGANLSDEKQALARATCSQWTYDILKLQLKKIFDHSTDNNPNFSSEGAVGGIKFDELQIKSEPLHCSKSEEVVEDSNLFSRGRNNYNQRNYSEQRNSQAYDQRNYSDQRDGHRLNPIMNGTRMKCIQCKSIYHLIRDCPYKSSQRNPNQNPNPNNRNFQRAYLTEDENEEPEIIYVQLFTSSHCTTKAEEEIAECYISSLVGECLGKCILDCGCNCSVAGKEWSDDYIASLDENEQSRVKESTSTTKFKFGDGKVYQASKKINVPAQLGSKNVMIQYHVIDADLPLLLSKNAMQDAGCVIDFQKEKVMMFGNSVDLSFTQSGHYTVALSPKVHAGTTDKPVTVLFNVKNLMDKTPEEKKKLAKRWHHQFGHAVEHKLKKLIKDGGLEDEDTMKAIEEACNQCEVCIKHKKPKLKPIVCISLSRIFNEVVTLDLFFYLGNPIIHLCDAATRFSRASVLPSKKKDTVINAICILWISLFGPPQTILSDNGGEFTSHDFREMGAKLNTTILSTATESPWSNGINERHHAIITNMLDRILDEHKLPLQVALSWSCAAKNALANVYGYSPNQLLYGHNPNYPSTLTNELPALETESNSETILNNIKAMTSAREAFIKAESCEKLKRATKHKIRTSTSLDYQIGEEVFYKRNDIDMWLGPGKIIGIDGKNILIRHQANVLSVSPCRVAHRAIANMQDKTSTATQDQVANMQNKITTPDQRHEEPRLYETQLKEESDDELESIPVRRVENGQLGQDIIDEVANEVEEVKQSKKRGRPPKHQKPKEKIIKLPPINSDITYKLKDEEEWRRGKVLSRAGKSTGANKNHLNIQDNADGAKCINFETNVEKWKKVEEGEEQILFGTVVDTETVREAQQAEIRKWQEHDVYETVPDEGQKATTVRWVITKKKDKVKARLVARGYEEECFKELRKDSPTVRKPVFRLVIVVVTSKGWKINCLDIQSAYLQGQKVTRIVLLRPPPEAENDGLLWKLHKAVYGLGDGGRKWYLRVEEEIKKLNAKKSKYDTAIFMWYDEQDELVGIIAGHVDDYLWAGTPEFAEKVIKPLTTTFKVSKEEVCHFHYLGLEVNQRKEVTEISQIAYANEIQPIEFDQSKGRDEKLNESEKINLRSYVGQIQWLASQTRPDLSYSACEASVEFSEATISTLHKANKVIRRIRNHDVKLKLVKLENLKECNIVCYTDASLNNLPRSGSQIGFLICISNGEKAIPIVWKSSRAKRVVRSTIAAECLALAEGAGVCYYIRLIMAEIINIQPKELDIICYTDNKNLFNAVNSTHSISDTRLYADIAELRDKIEQEEITKIQWIPGDQQLANALTKEGASTESLLRLMEYSQITQ